MVQTITPVVHGGSRRRWAASLVLHVLGAVVSSALFGALLGATGAVLGAPWGREGMLIVAVIAIAYATREVTGLRVPILELRRQVPEWWRGALGARTSSFLYGLALGPGVGTHLRHGTFVAIAVLVMTIGDPVVGAVILGTFGLARAIGVSVVSNARTSSAVGLVGDRLERVGSGALPRIANGIALLALAAASLMTSPPSGAPAAWVWPAALAATFAWAAAAKLSRRAVWREALGAHALPGWIERVAEPAIPVLELGIVLFVLAGRVREGAMLAMLLLAAFSLALLRARRSDDGLVPCGCFGGRTGRSVRWLLTRNATLALISTMAFVFGEPIPFPSSPRAAELVPVLMTAVGILLAAGVLSRAVSLANPDRVKR